jgi:nucleotide-binding universal stress UspA family protein
MPTVLIAYDGSADSDRAVQAAHRLVRADRVIVATVWESSMASMPIIAEPGISGFSMADAMIDPRTERVIDDSADGRAHGIAEQGAQSARRCGFADVHAVVALDSSDVAHTLLEIAAEHHADLLVVGSRGHGGVLHRLTGSTSTALVRLSKLPVLVAPPV